MNLRTVGLLSVCVLLFPGTHASVFIVMPTRGGGWCEAEADRWWCQRRATPQGQQIQYSHEDLLLKTIFAFLATKLMLLVSLSSLPQLQSLKASLYRLPKLLPHLGGFTDYNPINSPNSNLGGVVFTYHRDLDEKINRTLMSALHVKIKLNPVSLA